MNCKIILTRNFTKQAKKLSKKHRSLKNDLKLLFESLQDNPFQGVQISENIYKVRVAIKSKGKGKSNGARVINYIETRVESSVDSIDVNVLTIYDKSDAASISTNDVKKMVEELRDQKEELE